MSTVQRHAVLWGFALTILSCMAFALAAPVAKTMYVSDWSAGPVTGVRLAGSALVLAIPTALMMRRRWHLVRINLKGVIAYGVVTMSGVQLLFFLSVERLKPSIALLLEMTAPLLIVFFLWIRSRKAPPVPTFVGMVLSMGGLVIVLDPRGAVLDPLGVVFAMGAAACLAAFFMLSARTDTGIPTVPLLGIGMAVGAVVVGTVCLLGIVPVHTSAQPITVAHLTMPWWVGLLAIVGVTVVAYTTGVAGIRLIGATVSSFLNLVEVPISVIAAWWMLGDLPTLVQLLGGIVVLAGVVFVKIGDALQERRDRRVVLRSEVDEQTGQLAQVAAEVDEQPLPTGSLALVPDTVISDYEAGFTYDPAAPGHAELSDLMPSDECSSLERP